MNKKKIAIIGTGHIGRALFNGLIRGKEVDPSQFVLTNHDQKKLEDLSKKYGVATTSNNQRAVANSAIILFCVKPKDIRQVVQEVRANLDKSKLIISVAACVTIDLLRTYLGDNSFPIIRIMPNIAVAQGEGVIGFKTNGKVKKEKLFLFKRVFSRLGLLTPCRNEEELEKLSLIAGCGIGYVAYFMKNLSLAAEKYGFSQKEAQKIAQTVFASTVNHLKVTKQTPDELMASVATKGGITQEVLDSLEKGKFFELFFQSIEKGLTKVGKITNDLKKEV